LLQQSVPLNFQLLQQIQSVLAANFQKTQSFLVSVLLLLVSVLLLQLTALPQPVELKVGLQVVDCGATPVTVLHKKLVELV
jgi:hypothetical protein